MSRALVGFWNRQPFVARLLTTASFALLVAGAAMILVSARQEARDARADLAADLAGELESLPNALAEVVVIGDFATLQQSLDRYVGRPRVARVEFVDTSGITLRSRDKPVSSAAPDWFLRGLGFRDVGGGAPVVVGGREYGRVALTLSSQALADRAWERLLGHLAILVLAVALDFLGIWLVLRHGLAPLKRLEQGANALARGQLDTRLEAEGSPELRHLIDAFNRMAAATQSARDGLHRANADLTRFAEISAHHLMEPTRRLSSYAQRLRAHLDMPHIDGEARLALDYLERDAGRLRGLVRDIQIYLAAGAPRAEVRTQDANAVLADVERHLQASLAAAQARIETLDLPPARIDRPRLADLFAALLENALTHARPGVAPRIRVTGERLENVMPPRSRYRVADNGPGIAATYRERVFEIFERLVPAGEGGGSGIGLAIARRIVESRDGAIRIEDSDLGGVAVIFELPDGN